MRIRWPLFKPRGRIAARCSEPHPEPYLGSPNLRLPRAAEAVTAMATAALASSAFAGSKLAAGNARKPASCIKLTASSVRCEAERSNDNSIRSNKAAAAAVQRRVMVAGAVVALMALGSKANAVTPVPPGEVKPGSKEALKKYANICRSNPTAAVCHG